MKSQKLTVLLAAVILVAAASGQEPEKQPEPDMSNTRMAACLVKVNADPEILPLNIETMENLLHSSGVAGKAAREVLDISLDESHEIFSIEPLSTDSRRTRGRTSRRPPRPKPAATRPSQGPDAHALEELEIFKGLSKFDPKKRRKIGPERRPADQHDERARFEQMIMMRSRETPEYRRKGYAPKKPPAPKSFVQEQVILLRLEVDLPEGVKPAAQEFMNAIVANLRSALRTAWESCYGQLHDSVNSAKYWSDKAQEELSKAMKQTPAITSTAATAPNPADAALFKQLDQTVDLSALGPDMTFADAIEELKRSVDPPLRIVVLWRDLVDNADIDQTTPINMDTISSAPLGAALELLLKSVSAGLTELGYVVKDGIITVATVDSLPSSFETWVYDVHPALDAYNLIRMITNTIERDSWFETGVGEGTINIYQGRKLIVGQTPQIQQEIQNFLGRTLADSPHIYIQQTDTPVEMLQDRKYDLLRQKQTLEMEIARLEARRCAIEEQTARINEQVAEKVKSDPTAFEIQRLVDLNFKQLERAKEALDSGKRVTGIDEVTEKIARAKIDLARRREELSQAVGGAELARLSSRLTELMIELPEKKAELEVVARQLEETDQQLTVATTFDPQLSQIRLAKEVLEAAEHRLGDLKIRLANLAEPTVTILGAD